MVKKPCPFCGLTETLIVNDGLGWQDELRVLLAWVECENCLSKGPVVTEELDYSFNARNHQTISELREEAERKWNHRLSPSFCLDSYGNLVKQKVSTDVEEK